mmetsp:Transcript_8258/g.12513  ORF Transcript_8258/g.12513 Transcript_8258/m.12513 type:complete len:229 (+) Transcript_8258:404-1090(+)
MPPKAARSEHNIHRFDRNTFTRNFFLGQIVVNIVDGRRHCGQCFGDGNDGPRVDILALLFPLQDVIDRSLRPVTLQVPDDHVVQDTLFVLAQKQALRLIVVQTVVNLFEEVHPSNFGREGQRIQQTFFLVTEFPVQIQSGLNYFRESVDAALLDEDFPEFVEQFDFGEEIGVEHLLQQMDNFHWVRRGQEKHQLRPKVILPSKLGVFPHHVVGPRGTCRIPFADAGHD